MLMGQQPSHKGSDIAIIGMSGRFPGAEDIGTFWRNISTGVESFAKFSDEELIEAGVDPNLFNQPEYVRSRPVLDTVRAFDAEFFGYAAREATLADPQQRIFLECVWETLEMAGYAAPEGRGTVGVYAGMNISSYLLTRMVLFQMGADTDGLMIGNDKDSLATNVSFRLDLRGPSLSVQTFCSTSLVAVHLAAESLRRGECDMAIAGGVSIRLPDRVGYLYQDGNQASPDGHVRTFDAKARGSMFGDGASCVALKRLDDAVADRDTVLAVIRGSAINNDGALKFSYLAPSIDGQRRCVAKALANAGVDPSEISYVEAHGTATEVGDPMEVAALTSAFGATEEKQYCLLGSIKPNVGHLDRASGGTGLIKVVQSLRHELIPGTRNFESPNPEIDFANSPFRVTAEPTPWPRNPDRPRIAGVSSLGMGGTNAHAIITEAPEPAPRPERPRRWQILPVSARSEQAAAESCTRLSEWLAAAPGLDIGDVAYTLQVGRRLFNHRRIVVADSTGRASTVLAGGPGMRARHDPAVGRSVGFLIAGVGEQYPGMVAALYADEPEFRQDVDECLSVLGMTEPSQLSDMFTPAERTDNDAASDLARLLGRADSTTPRSTTQAHLVQPAIFVAEYALARQLMRWGIRPSIMVGYSLGEYVAACLSGVLSLSDALRLVAHRAELIASQPEGAMLAVAADEQQLRVVLGADFTSTLDVAVRTGSQLVLAGPIDDVEGANKLLVDAEIGCRRLETSHAYHSRMLAPIAGQLTEWIAENITLNAPTISYVSNVTGGLATEELVTDPGYWARHMCETVEFGAGLAAVLDGGALALAEIGPGQSLGALTRGHPDCDRSQWPLIVSTLPGATDQQETHPAIAEAVGKLWLTGVTVNWPALHTTPGSDWAPGRVPLSTYPFQRQDYWLDVDMNALTKGGAQAGAENDDPLAIFDDLPKLDDTQFIYVPVWKRTTLRPPRPDAERWLVYTDAGIADTITETLRAHLEAAGSHVTLVRPGEKFEVTPEAITVRPGSPEDATAALLDLTKRELEPERIVHLWTADDGSRETEGDPTADCLERGFHTLVAFARAAGDLGLPTWALDIVATRSHRVLQGERVRPERGTLLGPTRLIPVEYPGVRTRLIDVDVATVTDSPQALLAELRAEPEDQVVGLRSGWRWVPDYERLDAACIDESRPAAKVRQGGVYLVTGGLGGIGLAMAERLAAQYKGRLVLMGRTPVPPREQWAQILAADTTVDEVRRRLEGLQRLTAAGVEVATVAGDVSRVEDVRRAVDTAIERFGELNGVLHCAGVPALGLMQFKTAADAERVLAPKVAGTLALAEALRDVPVDFMLLFSSTTSATGGGAGQVDYCAANSYLDAFSHGGALPGCAIATVDWCEWTYNGWTIGLDGYDDASRGFFEWYRANFGLTFDEGWLTLQRVLASGEPHVVVSTQDFPPLVAMSRRSSIAEHQAVVKKVTGLHPRPDLSTAYVEPSTPAEEAICEVWSEALGLEQIGIHDNFFELGGNSLVGMEIIAKVRKALELTYLPPHLLYQAPTVASLAEAAMAGQEQDSDENGEQEDKAAGAREQNRSRIEQRRNMLRGRTTS